MKSKEDWEKNLKSLKEVKDKLETDIEEMAFVIECYEAKVAQFGA